MALDAYDNDEDTHAAGNRERKGGRMAGPDAPAALRAMGLGFLYRTRGD